MTKSTLMTIAAVLTLSACAQEAGRSDYWDNLSPATPGAVSLPGPGAPVTLAELRASADIVPITPSAGGTIDDELLVASLSSAIERAGTGQVVTPLRVADAPPLPVVSEVIAAAPVQTVPEDPMSGSTTISDNSFDTVVQEQSIETDRERLARLSAQRVELQAAPLPERAGDVNLAAFARSTTHKIGDRVYPRTGLLRNRTAAQCRKYRNPDEAQRAFLGAGGPNEDPLKIDPDGDGFVCGWSPIPFRALDLPG